MPRALAPGHPERVPVMLADGIVASAVNERDECEDDVTDRSVVRRAVAAVERVERPFGDIAIGEDDTLVDGDRTPAPCQPCGDHQRVLVVRPHVDDEFKFCAFAQAVPAGHGQPRLELDPGRVIAGLRHQDQRVDGLLLQHPPDDGRHVVAARHRQIP